MLDDQNLIQQRDPQDALGVAAHQAHQVAWQAEVMYPEHDGRNIEQVIVTGMGGSALAALLVKAWLKDVLRVPFEVVRSYELPHYVDRNTLVIASSYSGNTEETVSALAMAQAKAAQTAVLASGGTLIESAHEQNLCFVELPGGLQPRMAVPYNLRGLVRLLGHFDVIDGMYYDKLAELEGFLEHAVSEWGADVPTEHNYAKQLALKAVGKTPVFYAGSLMAPVAYKWKISWNENAKNVSFWNEYPEFNHNEFMGWTSHPVDKPFAVFDLISSFEHPQILKRFDVSDQLLSGRRPKAEIVSLVGETPLAQMLWASILADYVSIYVAILNGVNPTPVDLIEKLKKALA